MKTRIALIGVLIVGAGAAAFVYQMLPPPVPVPEPELERPSKPTGPSPKLEVVGPRTYQFGTITVRGKGAHAWEFKNVGPVPLDVWLQETTCSCTVASLKGTEKGQGRALTIAPGQSTPIEVGWEGRHDGTFIQSATIGTNDPDNPSVVLSVIGNVILPVVIRPSESIAFPEGTPEESRRASLKILSNDRSEMKLLRLATSRPGLIVADARPMAPAELDREKARAGYDVMIEVKPGMPAGRFVEELAIETDNPGRPALKVPLSGNTVGPITVSPSRVQMPSVPRGAGGSQRLALIVRGGREVHFRVASKPENLRVEIAPDDKPGTHGRYRLTVTVPPGLPTGLVDRPILLETDHPKLEKIRIPVSIYVSNRPEAG